MNNNTKAMHSLEVHTHLFGNFYPLEAEYSGSPSDLLEQAQDFGKYSNNPTYCYYVTFPDGTSTVRIVSYAALLHILREEVERYGD